MSELMNKLEGKKVYYKTIYLLGFIHSLIHLFIMQMYIV